MSTAISPEHNPGMNVGELSPEQFYANIDQISQDAPEAILSRGSQYAQTLVEDGANQIGMHLTAGEQEAVKACLRNYLKPGDHANMLVIGEYGIGKTATMNDISRVVHGLDNVLGITMDPSMTGEKILGNRGNVMTKTTVIEGEIDREERISADRLGLVSPEVQEMNIDEANRGAREKELGALSAALGSRRLEIGNDSIDLGQLISVRLIMNPYEDPRTTTHIPGHVISRLASVAVFGQGDFDSRMDRKRAIRAMDFGPEKIEPVIDMNQLLIARRAIALVGIDTTLAQKADEYSIHASFGLKRHDIPDVRKTGEGDVRMGLHIESDAKARALASGREKVTEEDVDVAARGKVYTMLAALGAKDLDTIEPLADDILSGKYSPRS